MAKTKESFFQKLFGSLFGGNDPEAQKRKLLKSISKDLSRTGFKFYKASSDSILPQYGKFFWDVYKIISSAQVYFQGQPNPNYYKNLVIEFSLTENQKKLSEGLTEEAIIAMAKNMNYSQLCQKVKNDVETLLAEFDMNRIGAIDSLYTKLMSFKSFCTYDFYFMLKKFDSSIREGDFSRTPRFDPIDAAYIAEDLKDFVSILNSMPLDLTWDDLMLMFKKTKGSEPVKPGQWNKVVSKLRQLRDNRVFDMVIQLATKDPTYITDKVVKQEHAVESYIDSIKKQTNDTLKKLESQMKTSKIDSLVTQLFNTNQVITLQNYTDKASQVFEKKNLGRYEYAVPLNYMKAFLLEYVKKDVREYADLVLIRGKFTTLPLSTEMSEFFHLMMETSEAISTFDAKMALETEIGLKLKTYLPRAERDREANNIIKTTLRDVNGIAREYLINCTKAMMGFAKTLKLLIEDYQKGKGELVMNWKEIDRFSERPVNQLGIEVYKKLYLFVQLMQGFLQ